MQVAEKEARRKEQDGTAGKTGTSKMGRATSTFT